MGVLGHAEYTGVIDWSVSRVWSKWVRVSLTLTLSVSRIWFKWRRQAGSVGKAGSMTVGEAGRQRGQGRQHDSGGGRQAAPHSRCRGHGF